MTTQVEDAVFALLEARDTGKTICPSEAARAISLEHWRSLMPEVRAEAVRLAKAGRLAITRDGQPVDPDSFKGVYRLRLP